MTLVLVFDKKRLYNSKYTTERLNSQFPLGDVGERLITKAIDIVEQADHRFFSKLGEEQETLTSLLRSLGTMTTQEN